MCEVKKIFNNKIKIQNLKVFAKHGVYEKEKNGQIFILNLTLNFNFDQATKFDNLNFTINYDTFCDFVIKTFSKYKFNLLETAAKFLIEQILLKFQQIKSVTIEVHKEQALFKNKCSVQCVKIQITDFWHTVYLSLGSNLGKRLKNIFKALNLLKKTNKIKVLKISNIFKNKAYGRKMANFFNCVVKIKTLIHPFELLEICNEIEHKLKRVRTIKWGPRTIDVDILFFDDLIIHNKQLTIPHIEILKRSFVLNPMCEIDPYFVHPIYKKTILELKNLLN